MSSWNGLDFFILILLVLNMVLGMVRGGSRETISLICLSVALIVAIRFTVPVANLINSSPLILGTGPHTFVLQGFTDNSFVKNFLKAIDSGPITVDLLYQTGYSLSLLICFIGTFAICEAGLSMTGFFESYGLAATVINRKLGAALGLTRGYVLTLVLLSIIAIHLNPGGRSQVVSGSFFASFFDSQTRLLDRLISSQDVEKYHELYQKQNIQPEELYKVLKKPPHLESVPEQQGPAAVTPPPAP